MFSFLNSISICMFDELGFVPVWILFFFFTVIPEVILFSEIKSHSHT